MKFMWGSEGNFGNFTWYWFNYLGWLTYQQFLVHCLKIRKSITDFALEEYVVKSCALGAVWWVAQDIHPVEWGGQLETVASSALLVQGLCWLLTSQGHMCSRSLPINSAAAPVWAWVQIRKWWLLVREAFNAPSLAAFKSGCSFEQSGVVRAAHGRG